MLKTYKVILVIMVFTNKTSFNYNASSEHREYILSLLMNVHVLVLQDDKSKDEATSSLALGKEENVNNPCCELFKTKDPAGL